MGLALATDGQGQGWLREPREPNVAEEGAHQLPTHGKMSLLGPGLDPNCRGMKRRLAPPPAVYKQGHVELSQHRAHIPQIPDRTVYTPRTGGRHGAVGMSNSNFGIEKQKLGNMDDGWWWGNTPWIKRGPAKDVSGKLECRSDTGQQSKDELVFIFLGINRGKTNVSTEVASIQSLDSDWEGSVVIHCTLQP